MKLRRAMLLSFLILLAMDAKPQEPQTQVPRERPARTKVVLLGTGTPDRRIVISGDTSPTEETIKACNGCDVLVHEAQMLELYAKMPERLHSFVTKFHTTTEQLAALATEARPKLLVVYHTVAFRAGIAPPKFLSSLTGAGTSRSTPEVLQEEIGSRYSGQFVVGRDLDVY
jgi:ribonuclease BN (tRNA processing enzyme)